MLHKVFSFFFDENESPIKDIDIYEAMDKAIKAEETTAIAAASTSRRHATTSIFNTSPKKKQPIDELSTITYVTDMYKKL